MNWKNWKKEDILANGVKVWHRQTASETALICVLLDAGSKHDGAVPGIAHFTEHMLFQGTINLPDEQIKFVAAENGIRMNAATSKEFLFVEASTILPDKIETALNLCKEAVVNPVFAKEPFDREKRVVLSEIGDSEDSALRKAMELARANICDTSFKIPVLGTKESIMAATVKDMISFHKATFTPETTTVCYAGPLSLEDFVKLCNIEFGNWKKEKSNLKKSTNNKYLPNKSKIINRSDLTQAGVVLAFPGLSFEDDDSLKLKVLCGIIGGGMVSRMFRELRNKQGLCYYCAAGHQTFFESKGLLSFYGSTGTANVANFVSGIKDLLKNLISIKPITEKELAIVKTVIKSSMSEIADNLSEHVDMFVYMWSGKTIRHPYKDLELIEQITLKDINDIAEKFLSIEPEVFLVGNISDEVISSLKLGYDNGDYAQMPISGTPSRGNLDRPTPAGTAHPGGPNKIQPSFNPGNKKVESMDDVLKNEEDDEEENQHAEIDKNFSTNDNDKPLVTDVGFISPEERRRTDEQQQTDENAPIDEQQAMNDTEPTCIPKGYSKCSSCGKEFEHLEGIDVKKCPDCKIKDIDFQQPANKVSIYNKKGKASYWIKNT